MTDTHEDDGRWGTVSEAAQALGVSVDTIRRRMKRGEMDTRREQTPQGFRWLIRLPDETLTGEVSVQAPQNAPGSSLASDHGRRSLQLCQLVRHMVILRRVTAAHGQPQCAQVMHPAYPRQAHDACIGKVGCLWN